MDWVKHNLAYDEVASKISTHARLYSSVTWSDVAVWTVMTRPLLNPCDPDSLAVPLVIRPRKDQKRKSRNRKQRRSAHSHNASRLGETLILRWREGTHGAYEFADALDTDLAILRKGVKPWIPRPLRERRQTRWRYLVVEPKPFWASGIGCTIVVIHFQDAEDLCRVLGAVLRRISHQPWGRWDDKTARQLGVQSRPDQPDQAAPEAPWWRRWLGAVLSIGG